MLEDKVLSVSAQNFESEIEATALSQSVKGTLIYALDRLLVHKTRAPHIFFEKMVDAVQTQVAIVVIDGIPYHPTFTKKIGNKGYYLKLEQTDSVSISG